MRVLGVDLGSQRIGIAVSDALGLTVRPVETIKRSSIGKEVARLKELALDLEAEAIVVGLPLRMDGSVGSAARKVNKFIERLRKEVNVEVFAQDERLTSYEADQIMIERGLNRDERRKKSDEIAAVLILQDYLSQKRTDN